MKIKVQQKTKQKHLQRTKSILKFVSDPLHSNTLQMPTTQQTRVKSYGELLCRVLVYGFFWVGGGSSSERYFPEGHHPLEWQHRTLPSYLVCIYKWKYYCNCLNKNQIEIHLIMLLNIGKSKTFSLNCAFTANPGSKRWEGNRPSPSTEIPSRVKSWPQLKNPNTDWWTTNRGVGNEAAVRMCSPHFVSHLGPTVNAQEGVIHPWHYPIDPSVKKSKCLL